MKLHLEQIPQPIDCFSSLNQIGAYRNSEVYLYTREKTNLIS